MGQIWRWTRRVFAALVILVAALAVGVYVSAERMLRRTYDVPMSTTTPAAATPDTLARGEHTARLLGCLDCHGERLEGKLFFSERGVADLVAPNLSELIPTYTDGELARAIRHGVRRDGTGLFAMPAASFYHLADEDLQPLLAFLRHRPRVAGYTNRTHIGPLGRVGLATGRFAPAPDGMDHRAARVARGGADLSSRGRYLATVACSECHGLEFQGGLDGKAPPLAIAAAYTDDAFRHLMRTGEPLGNRALYLMGGVARVRFSHFTDEEITAVHTYLRSLVR